LIVIEALLVRVFALNPVPALWDNEPLTLLLVFPAAIPVMLMPDTVPDVFDVALPDLPPMVGVKVPVYVPLLTDHDALTDCEVSSRSRVTLDGERLKLNPEGATPSLMPKILFSNASTDVSVICVLALIPPTVFPVYFPLIVFGKVSEIVTEPLDSVPA
jgi:hypothetical protein